MRQSRRLALMLAAQFIPFAAYAQTTQRTPPANANASSDDDDSEEDEEEETSSAPAASPSSSSSSESSSSSSEAASNAPPEADVDRRLRMLPRYSSLDGSIGLLRTGSAMLGAAGTFRFGLIAEYFSASDFLRPTGAAGTAFVGGIDDARHVGGTLTLSWSPLDFLEVFSSIRAYANANNHERPGLFQVLGDTNLGVRAAGRVTRGFYVGGDAAVYLLNRSGDVGLMLDSTSAQFRALASLDLKEITGSVPLRFHFNARYYLDNSANIVSDVETRRRAAQAGFDPSICATVNDARCFLEISRVERFALGINRHDQVGLHVGVEATLPYVHPFLEWNVAIPVNRQGYQCYDPGTTGTRPGGMGDDDSCLGQTGFSSFPSRLSLGARVLPPVRGLAALIGFDIATTGSSDFVRELSPTQPWQLYLGASFAYDTHGGERVEVPVERVVTREVDRSPPGGTVVGSVRDAESHTGVGRAYVTFTGHPDLHILATASDGAFRSGRIPAGDYRVHVEADGYTPNDCNFTIAAPAAEPAPAPAGGSTPAATPATPAPATPTPAAEAGPVTVTCELRPLPRRGNLSGHVSSSQGGTGVRNATVTITPAPGFPVPQGGNAPVEQVVTTDDTGGFLVSDLTSGPYLVSVGPTAQHLASTPQPVTVAPRATANVDITARRRPAAPGAVLRGGLIVIARQVHFQTNSAEILPDSNTLLEEIADVIRRNTTIATVEIQGHTDNTGQAQNNMTLSQSRAESVRDALTRLGVSADRLTARGFGQTRPLRPNLTPMGRAANRRVEFHVSRGR